MNILYNTVGVYVWEAPAGHTTADVIAAYDHLVDTLKGEVPIEVSEYSVAARGSLRYAAVLGERITWNDVVENRSIGRISANKYKMAVLLRCAAWLEGTYTTDEGVEMELNGPTLKFIRETDGDYVTDEFEMFEAAQLAIAKQLNAKMGTIVQAVNRVPQGGSLAPRKVTDLSVIQLFRDAPERMAKQISEVIAMLFSLLANVDENNDFASIREGMHAFTEDVLPAGLSMRLWRGTAGFVDRETAGILEVMKTLADHTGAVRESIERGLRGVSAGRRNEIIQQGVQSVVRATSGRGRIDAYEHQVRVIPRVLMEDFEEALADEIGTAEVQAILAALRARHMHVPPEQVTAFPPSRIHTAAPGMRGRKKRRSQTKGKKRSKSARSRRRQHSKRRGGGGKGKK